jgi:phosphoglycolate phosphatase
MGAVLGLLRARGPLAVLTNKPLAETRAILAGLDLAQYFDADAVVGGDGPFARKPDPAGLLHLAARSGVAASDTLLVGDSAIDWRAARNAAAAVCLARYGFGFENVPIGDLRSDDRVIDAPVELLAL